MPDYPTYVTHLECSYTGERYPADQVHGLSAAGKPELFGSHHLSDSTRRKILEAIREFCGDSPCDDDLSIMAIEILDPGEIEDES